MVWMIWNTNHGGGKKFSSSSERSGLFWIPPILLFDWLLAVRPRRESHHPSRHRLHLAVNNSLCADGVSVPQQKDETVRFLACFCKAPIPAVRPNQRSIGLVRRPKRHVHHWSPSPAWLNPLNTKRRPLYLKTQSVPRCKHFSSRL